MIDTDGYRRSERYSEFHTGRAQTVRIQAMAEIDGRLVGRDFSASRWIFKFRAWVPPAVATGQTFVNDVTMDKIVGTTSAGDTGKAQIDVTFAAAAVGDIECEVVVIDNDSNDAPTPSGKAEYKVDAPWRATVYLAPGSV